MNHTKYILFFFLNTFNVLGQQNLILNGDFEEYWECPQALTEIEKCKYVYNPCYHAQPPTGPPIWSSTSDYFNSCSTILSGCSSPTNSFGFQEARSGNGYLGLSNCDLWSNYREYIQLSFSAELKPFATYKFSMYINLANNGGYSSRNLGFRFTNNLIYYSDYISEFLTPDIEIDTLHLSDTLEWTEVTFEYVAKGGEKYLIIGNFKANSTGNCVFNHISPDPLSTDYCYFLLDDASLNLVKDAEPILFPNIFTPNNDGINDFFEVDIPVDQFSVINRWGNVIIHTENIKPSWNGLNANGELMPDGIYYYTIEINDSPKTGMIQLIR